VRPEHHSLHRWMWRCVVIALTSLCATHIRLFAFCPPEPCPLGVSVSSMENKCLQGWPSLAFGDTGRPWRSRHWVLLDFLNEAVVKISFLLLFLTRHFGFLFCFCFVFARTMFLQVFFFSVYILVFSSDLTFLCKHIHAHTFIYESEIKCQ